ncbi:MAG: methyltransferase [Euryarchaeota archaeon]|nr:methyltransferase [Euryarchaeota archaeon]
MSLPGSIEVLEGRTRLQVPHNHSSGGPGKRIGRVFYNSQMAFNRDISVMFLRARPVRSALDAMAGTGARAIRWAVETDVSDITANDRDPNAVEYIRANIDLNNVNARCNSTNEDLRCMLARRAFDMIDIDPFGSPVHYIPAAVQAVKRRGLLAITATDTAPLAGTYPKKSMRRYGAVSMRSPFGHESGLRILIGHVMREAAKEDRGARCLLSFYADHYFRIYLQMEEGGAAADRCLKQMGYVENDPATGYFTYGLEYSNRSAGPLWLGPLHDHELLSDMEATNDLSEVRRCEKYLELWRSELDMPFFYENDELSSFLGISPPRMDLLLEKLNEVGKASKTHFSPTAIKTDLPIEDILSIYQEASASNLRHD